MIGLDRLALEIAELECRRVFVGERYLPRTPLNPRIDRAHRKVRDTTQPPNRPRPQEITGQNSIPDPKHAPGAPKTLQLHHLHVNPLNPRTDAPRA